MSTLEYSKVLDAWNWAIIKANCECNCRYDLYKCIEWSFILQSFCTFQKKYAYEFTNYWFFFSFQYIHFLFSTKRVNLLLPKLARNTSIEYRVGRVLNCLKNQVLSTRSFNFKKTSNYSSHNLEYNDHTTIQHW